MSLNGEILSANSPKILQGRHLSVFEMAIHVANSVIPFDSHRIYLSWAESELLWSLHGDFYDSEVAFDRSREFHCKLMKSGSACLDSEENSKHLCVARLETGDKSSGYIAVSRSTIGYELPISGKFTEIEKYHLKMVAQLIGGAIADPEAYGILRRLYLNILHRQSSLQQLPLKAILREYLFRAASVCHNIDRCVFEDHAVGQPEVSQPAIRPSIKLLNENGTVLTIQDCISTHDGDWSDKQKKLRYPLPVDPELPKSFAAKAFVSRRTHISNNYQDEVGEEFKAFKDTQSHLSSPIIAGHGNVIGVLAIDSAGFQKYSMFHDAALTLLSGHAGWTLNWIKEQQDSSEVTRLLADELLGVHGDISESSLLPLLRDSLIKCGYRRGTISRVTQEDGGVDVRGIIGWGGAKMKAVCEITKRNSTMHPNDCQILAAETGKPQLIDDPDDDARVDRAAYNSGKLEPFGIYPVLDEHCRSVWTIHLEREDIARHNETDYSRVKALGRRVMIPRVVEQRSCFERTWNEELSRTSFYSLRDVLCRFADCAVGENGIAVRCRVFEVTADNQQIPLYQVGAYTSPNFHSTNLKEEDQEVLNSRKPLLFIRKENDKSDLESSDEFHVLHNVEDIHEEELNNVGRTQWVEIPIHFDGRVVAKIVLDHYKSPDDSFTQGEMRLIAGLTRNLSIAAEAVEAYQAIAGLCCSGLHLRLIHHFVMRCVDSLNPYGQASLDEVKKSIVHIHETLERLPLFTKSSDKLDPRVVLNNVREACGYLMDEYNIPEIKLKVVEDCPQEVLGDPASLFLILVTFITNSCQHAYAPEYYPKEVEVSCRLAKHCDGKDYLLFQVSDQGVGLSSEKKIHVEYTIKNPVSCLIKGEARGLSLAAFLSNECNWLLKIDSMKNPTSFAVEVPFEERII